MLIGILAFQGDYFLHQKILNKLKVNNKLVKNKKNLLDTNALIIPGGESTVISKFINSNMYSELIEYSKKHSIYGTCAGAILMSSKVDDVRIRPLNIVNVESIRNSWGRQIDSFSSNIKLQFSKKKYKASFIRAPKFRLLSEKIIVLSRLNNRDPILLRNKYHLISSFHPELGEDTRIHKYFLNMVNDE